MHSQFLYVFTVRSTYIYKVSHIRFIPITVSLIELFQTILIFSLYTIPNIFISTIGSTLISSLDLVYYWIKAD